MSDGYTATHGLMQLLRYQNNYPSPSTGSQVNADQAHALLGGIPPVMLQYSTNMQINLFGDYPTHKDYAPSAIFAAVFGIIMILHLVIFLVNYSRGHYFWLSLGWSFYGLCRFVGFVMRPIWAKDLSRTRIGISDEVFLILPSIFLVSFNLILAQRLFTWRHPVGGSRRLFWAIMIGLYIFVCGVVAMTIVASAVPYLYFLSGEVFSRYQKTVKCSAILIILYSLTSIALIALSYFFKPTTKDENLYTYQPWWIESFSPFYFVKKNAAQEAEETFMKRNHNHRHAIRVIAATHHHNNMVEGLTNERGDLKHNISLCIISISTLFIFLGAVLRAVVVFQGNVKMNASPVGSPVMMYIFWGLLETIINVMYLVGRVDLRFYRPDRLPQKVRAIITAEQSLEPSIMEYTDLFVSYPDTQQSYSPQTSEDGFSFHNPPRESYFSKEDPFSDDKSEFRF
ncbi:uncharacterized protein PRCAT00003817001 [Priceomyces carsonii]|uniref:uncharacterized protein n=1 Tax=Priceomyces carsonii TaxID=28549 RepID=UPI002EDBB487|nr:unnamed protein product [Priceomyces carsonii]